MDTDIAAALDRLRTGEGWLHASDGRFRSLFGRDASISALQLLPLDGSVADATLEVLGRAQGRLDDPLTEEEPGKIAHEIRDQDLDQYVAHGWPVREGRLRYFGSVDASAWYVILYGACRRLGRDPGRAAGRSAQAAAGWLAGQPDPLSYHRRTPAAGLQHQGWRDVAWDLEGRGHGPLDRAGRPLRPPVAMAEVAALAWRALVEATEVLGPAFGPARDRALQSFETTFLRGGGPPAFARHAGGIVSVATSDLGHILWTGILDHWPEAARQTAARLTQPDLATAFGLRTLSSEAAGFDVLGYHTGAVWPFVTWLGAGGLGPHQPQAAAALQSGMQEAVSRLGGFPELFGVGLDSRLVASPEACSTQAWTLGAVAAARAGWDGRAWVAG